MVPRFRLGAKRRRAALLSSVALILVAALAAASGAVAPDAPAAPPVQAQEAVGDVRFESATVVRVVDGDTLVVDAGSGSEKVRLIGVDAPESVASDKSRNTEEGRISSDYLKDALPAGTVVWLQQDVSDRDRYDRLLRYVWLEVPEDPFAADEVARNMLNGMLVDQGYAKAKRYKPDTAYAEVLERLGSDAASAGRGVSYAWTNER